MNARRSLLFSDEIKVKDEAVLTGETRTGRSLKSTASARC